MADPQKPTLVISGMSGRFPECDSVEELKKKLYSAENMVTATGCRWGSGLWGEEPHTGKLNNLSNFDAEFFNLPPAIVDKMDPQARIMTEVVYEAIIDAGVNPLTLRGSRTGVFVGLCFCDSEFYWFSGLHLFNKTGALHCFRSLLANRLSYIFDLKGPSTVIDCACSSSIYALEKATSSFYNGSCDAAVIVGCNLLLNPLTSSMLQLINATSTQGCCCSFDKAADGYVRSEAVAAIFLQKSEVARRHYAEIVHVGTNTDGHKTTSMSYPSREMQSRLLEETYRSSGIDPASVDYIEAHGTGTKVGDPEELGALSDVFLKNRASPLLIGSIKSNMGHAEGASGICSIIKSLLIFENNEIPPNLHYKNPNPKVPALLDGRLKVATNRLNWHGNLIGINSFGLGGSNAHVILKRPQSTQRKDYFLYSLTKVICVSGRNQLAVKTLLNKIQDENKNHAFQALIQEIYSVNVIGHNWRGYMVMNSNGSSLQDIQICNKNKKSVWFVFSGLGSQWPAAGKVFLQLSILKDIIRQCAESLQPFKIDLYEILQDELNDIHTDHTKAFISIVTIQICLVNLLRVAGVQADGIIGHSLGEIAAGYADGCLTAQQAVLCAYYRAHAIRNETFSGGAMLSAGISAEQAKNIIPPSVDIACYNSSCHIALSGPSTEITMLMNRFSRQDVIVKEIETSGVAFHSRYIKSAEHILLQNMRKVIPKSRKRSEKWISSSIHKSEWDSSFAKECSAEYLTHNMMSPVLFSDALSMVPHNAFIVEIAPQGILQGIMRGAMPTSVSITSVMTRHDNSLQQYSLALGRLYLSGSQISLSKLYPRIEYPVPAGTPQISPLAVWNHDQEWFVPVFSDKDWLNKHFHIYEIDLNKAEDEWYKGHTIDGRIIFPASGYLVLAWKTLAAHKGIKYENLPVIFHNVHFQRASIFPPTGKLTFSVEILFTEGQFVICESDEIVVSGQIFACQEPEKEFICLNNASQTGHQSDMPLLTSKEVYLDLHLQGYQYTGVFKGLLEIDGGVAKVCFTKNWVALIDTVLQVALMKRVLRYFSHFCVPTKLQKVIINPEKICQAGEALYITVDEALKTVGCEGMQFAGAEIAAIPRRSPNEVPLCNPHSFVPYHNFLTDTVTALSLCLQIFAENCVRQAKVKIAVFCDNDKAEYSSVVSKWLSENLWLMVKLHLICETNWTEATKLGTGVTICNEPTMNDYDLVLTDSLDQKRCMAMKNDGFMILISNNNSLSTAMKVLSRISSKDGTYIYFLQKEKAATPVFKTIAVTTDNQFSWLKDLKQCIGINEHDILLVSKDMISNGVIGLVNCLRKEPGGEKIRCLVLLDSDVPKFDPNIPFYSNQLSLGLVMNVYKEKCWGSYRYTSQLLEPQPLMTEYAYVNIQNPGNLSSLCWVQAEPPLKSNKMNFPENLFSVYYSALNFKDIMMASGKLPINVLPEKLSEQNSILGLEFSGKDRNGRRVMGLLPGQGFATNVISENVYDVPPSWSLEDAATVPIVYTTAYYALIIRGKLKFGETVLIHAGSGGVGQAAISIALDMNCTVYTTVSSQHKKQTLCSIFPQLKDCNFANSRDTSFEQHILKQTQGRGVDLVLNSLSGDKLQASVRCVAEYGRFIEIGQYDLYTDKQLGLGVFLKNISFHGVRLDVLFGSDHNDELHQLKVLMEEGLQKGVVKPLPRKVFSRNQVEEAFRYMAGGHHIGKVLLCIREEEKQESKISQPCMVQAKPRISFSHNAVCIVTGGLGGIGLQLSNWLVSRGLRQLVITSRRGVCTAYQQLCIQRWRKKGVTVHVAVDNMCTINGAKSILMQANKMGIVIGIFHLAAVIRDGLIQNQSVEAFREAWEPKYTGAYWLDIESRTLCPDLRYFVVFSSASAGYGVPGQTNYGFANSAVERLVECRRESGLPGLAVQWGPVADVGLAADLDFLYGVKHQTIGSCMLELEKLMLHSDVCVARCMVITNDADTYTSKNGHQRNSNLLTNITKVLGLPDISNLPPDVTLASLGMDSLMQIEIRLCIEQYFGKSLSAEEVRSLTVQNLLDFERAYTLGLSGEADSIRKPESPENMVCSQMESTEETPLNAVEREFVLLDLSVSPLVPEETMMVLAKETSCQRVPMFFVHPIDGTCRLLKEIAQNMKRTVYGLQFSYGAPRTTFIELAKFYTRQMRAVQPSGPYILLGYSVGGGIGYEMARQMEAAGETVLLIILDFLLNPMETSFTTLLTLEVGLLTQTVSFFISKLDEDELKAKLFSLPDWSSRLEYCLHLVGPDHPKDLQSALENCYWLIKAINEYSIPSNIGLKAPLLLVAATDGIIKHRINKRYNFQKLTAGPFNIKYVEGSHTTFLQGPDRCKAVAHNINEWLEENKSLLLSDFESKLCHKK